MHLATLSLPRLMKPDQINICIAYPIFYFGRLTPSSFLSLSIGKIKSAESPPPPLPNEISEQFPSQRKHKVETMVRMNRAGKEWAFQSLKCVTIVHLFFSRTSISYMILLVACPAAVYPSVT